MSITDDARIGLRATVHAGKNEVLKAAQRAAEALGAHAEAVAGAAEVTVRFYPGLIRAFSAQSPVVGVALSPGREDSVVVEAKIEKFRWTRQRLLWIPVTPKKMVGKRTCMRFLRTFKQELDGLDGGRGRVELVGVST